MQEQKSDKIALSSLALQPVTMKHVLGINYLELEWERFWSRKRDAVGISPYGGLNQAASRYKAVIIAYRDY